MKHLELCLQKTTVSTRYLGHRHRSHVQIKGSSLKPETRKSKCGVRESTTRAGDWGSAALVQVPAGPAV